MKSFVEEVEQYALGKDSVTKIIEEFKDYIQRKKDECVAATQLIELDALITRLHTMKKSTIEKINDVPTLGGKQKIMYLRRDEFFKSKTFKNKDDIDSYVDDLRKRLEIELAEVEEIKIS
jgi:prolyl oligopeptidase PreP (S9A serine peptidase family)